MPGQHCRPFPDYNGWILFEVFRSRKDGLWYWQSLCDDGDPRGFAEGPYQTAEEAQIAGALL
jgi:hypothetical protein